MAAQVLDRRRDIDPPQKITEVVEIIAGRDPDDLEKYGSRGCGFIGKHFVGERREAHLTNPVSMDLVRPHVVGIFGKRGTGKCLHPDTPVLLADGSAISIRELHQIARDRGRIVESNDSEELIEFSDIKLLTLTDNLKILPTSISHVYRKKVAEEILEIVTQSGRSVVVTKEHPLLSTALGELLWKEAAELSVGDYIGLSREIPSEATIQPLKTTALQSGANYRYGHHARPVTLPKTVTAEFARWLAYLISEGTEVKSRTQARLGFTNSDEKKLSEYAELTYRLFGHRPKRYADYLYLDLVGIARFLEENGYKFGARSAGKDIPEVIMKSPNHILAQFIQVLFDCEAHVNVDRIVIELSTASKRLAENLLYALQRFGVFGRIKEKIKFATNTRLKTRRKYYEVLITSSSIEAFAQAIGFSDDSKVQRLQKLLRKKRNPNLDIIPSINSKLKELRAISGLTQKEVYGIKQVGRAYEVGLYNPSRAFLQRIAEKLRNNYLYALATSDIFWDRIVDIRPIFYEGYVFDLTVPFTHNFIAKGVICHNSYTLGIMAEEIMLLPPEIKENVAAVMIDTMGIFWSMKLPNDRDFNLLRQWGMRPQGFNVLVLVPEGLADEYRKKDIPFDATIALRPADLSIEDWLLTFNIDVDSELGVLLARVVKQLRETAQAAQAGYTLRDIIAAIRAQEGAEQKTKEALANRFFVAEDWGIFSEKGISIRDIVRPGGVAILDVSIISSWNVRGLLVGLLARKILEERIKARRLEEIESQAGRPKFFMPITWMLLDEAHQFLPEVGATPATTPLLQWVKIGREPGVSLVMATQQPFKLHPDALSQCDLIVSHRITAKTDIDALGAIMQTYLKYNIGEYVDALPRVKGAAILLDDNSERLYAMRARPRMSWHAGGSPIAITA